MPVSFPARFVGEFPAQGEGCFDSDRLPHVGDVAIVRGSRGGTEPPDAAFIAIRCACNWVDVIPLAPYRMGWVLSSTDPIHFDPSVLVTCGTAVSPRCHYFVHNGRLEMLDDCRPEISHTLKCCGATTHASGYPAT